jgi:hypothetical protein
MIKEIDHIVKHFINFHQEDVRPFPNLLNWSIK